MRVPAFFRTVRFRLALTSSAIVFGTGAMALGAIYLMVRSYLVSETITRLRVQGEAFRVGDRVFIVPRQVTPEQVQSVEAAYRQLVLNRVTLTTFIILAVLFVFSLVMGWMAAGRLLRPIGVMTKLARDIEARDLSRRIEVDDRDDELGLMAATFNSMLDRLERSFSQQKIFLAQTSHDLRTPLAVMRSNLDVSLADPQTSAEQWRETAEVALRAGERMSSMIESLLTTARFESGELESVDLDLVSVADQLRQEAGARANVDGSDQGPVMVRGNRGSLLRAGGNLVENAIAVSDRITIQAGMEGDWGYLAVADRGRGFDHDLLLASPRLGLAIVRSIAEAHAGVLLALDRVGGGSVVAVFVPGADCRPEEPPVAIRLAGI